MLVFVVGLHVCVVIIDTDSSLVVFFWDASTQTIKLITFNGIYFSAINTYVCFV